LANQHEALSSLRACAITCYYNATSSRSVKSNIHAAHRLLLRTRIPVLSYSFVSVYTDTCRSVGTHAIHKSERQREKEGRKEKEKERKRTHSLLRPLILTEGDGVCTVRGCADGLRFRGRVKDTNHTSATV